MRAYLEHGMHKDAAAGEAVVPVELLPLRDARRPAASASSGRSARRRSARADPAVDAELILLLAELLEAIGARDVKLVIATLGQPELARRLPRGAQGVPAGATRTSSAEEVVDRIDLNPLRAFDAKHEPTQRVMAKAPRLIDRLPQEDLDHFAEVQDLLRAADLVLHGRHDARARARLLHAHAVRVPVRRAGGRAEHARRRRPLRRPGRGDRRRRRRPAWAGRPGSSGC